MKDLHITRVGHQGIISEEQTTKKLHTHFRQVFTEECET